MRPNDHVLVNHSWLHVFWSRPAFPSQEKAGVRITFFAIPLRRSARIRPSDVLDQHLDGLEVLESLSVVPKRVLLGEADVVARVEPPAHAENG